MAYTTINKGSDYFNTLLVSGDGTTSKSFTGIGFQPDLVWGKARDAGYSHFLYDAVRGAGAEKEIRTNSTDAEGASDNETYGYVSSFDSDGFSVTGSVNSAYFNQSAKTFVNWCWLANGAGSSNTDGSITSTVSASTTSGFSIVKYTGTGSNATVGHGLGVAPKMIIVKNLTNAINWHVYHNSLGAGNVIYLSLTNASTADSTTWNSTAPTSSVFSVGTDTGTNQSGSDFIAYCFAEKKGFSKIGSYIGNGSSDGTFVYTGFKPAFVLLKKTSAIANWLLIDNKRYNSAGNPVDKWLFADASDSEYDQAGNPIDFYSNGFKLRSNGATINNSGATHIYMAFAEHPLVSSTGTPCTAR